MTSDLSCCACQSPRYSILSYFWSSRTTVSILIVSKLSRCTICLIAVLVRVRATYGSKPSLSWRSSGRDTVGANSVSLRIIIISGDGPPKTYDSRPAVERDVFPGPGLPGIPSLGAEERRVCECLRLGRIEVASLVKCYCVIADRVAFQNADGRRAGPTRQDSVR